MIYYWIREYFADINEDDVSISDDKMKIQHLGNRNKWSNTNFGNIEIDSMCNNIYKWKLKVTARDKKLGEKVLISLGISSGTNKAIVFPREKNAIFYGFNCGLKYRRDRRETKESMLNFEHELYAKDLNCGDIIEIILDLQQSFISLIINEKNYGVAFDDVESNENLKYRLAVSFCDKDVSVELLDFEIMYH